ncbi:hypothetical protein NDU88_008858 [Pleurodeles waltl]|uniref:Uncharacterized protein n=1 Tax=Pleurodeles waltl TaxID=8319 RepID=A0AAV7QQ07_PLEWA|nr:hypothetical protein NDU88_008858 [Pleurodeles waltl]
MALLAGWAGRHCLALQAARERVGAAGPRNGGLCTGTAPEALGAGHRQLRSETDGEALDVDYITVSGAAHDSGGGLGNPGTCCRVTQTQGAEAGAPAVRPGTEM